MTATPGCRLPPGHVCPSLASTDCLHTHNLVTTDSNQSQSYVMTDGQLASLSCSQAPSGAQDWSFVTVRELRVYWCGAPSVMRGQVCHLQLVLALTSAVFLGFKSCRTHDQFYCLRFVTPPIFRAKFPYLYPPETGWPSYVPRHWVPFWLPPRTSKAMVEIFEPISTRWLTPESVLLYNWRFITHQFVLEPSPLKIMTRDYLFNWTLAFTVLTEHPLWWEDGCVSLYQVYVLHTWHIIENSSFCTIQ
jgi:hypothetical protein